MPEKYLASPSESSKLLPPPEGPNPAPPGKGMHTYVLYTVARSANGPLALQRCNEAQNGPIATKYYVFAM